MKIKKTTILLLSFILSVIFIIGCSSSPVSNSSDPENVRENDQENDNDQENENVEESSEDVIQVAWQASPHADTYILDSVGNNNSCARCHGPENWMPPMEDIPESCFTCKFTVDDPPSLIPESDWVDISCWACHEEDEDGNLKPEYSYLAFAFKAEYVQVESTTELCQKCHRKNAFQKHNGLQVGGVHADSDCTDCHDAHDASASCGSTGCHEEVSSFVGHDGDHQKVSCEACHDGSGLDLGFQEDGVFSTFITNEMDDEKPLVPFSSHTIVLESICDRCHFSGNPWSLLEDVE